jgi:hypothetical protein
MVEKVTAAGEEVRPGTQDTVPTQAHAPTQGGSAAGPTDHLKTPDQNMADPNGKCRACGAEIAAGATLCPHCGLTANDWNAKIDDFAARAKAARWNDAQIRQGAEDFTNQMKDHLGTYGQDSNYYQPYDSAKEAQGYVSEPPAWLKAVK